jgi:glycosyltransferase involved in cell wall biosynthesis
MKIAFLDSIFPGLTTTFLNREFEYLKDQSSIDVHPIAMKRPKGDFINHEYQDYIGITTYLRPDCSSSILLYNLIAFFTQPLHYLFVLRVIFSFAHRMSIVNVIKLYFHFLCGIYLSYYLKKNRFDAIHAHFTTATNIALVTHLFSKMPYTFTIHASADLYLEDVLLDLKVRYARKVITNNRYNIDHINLITYYRYRGKIHLIYNGLNVDHFHDSAHKIEFGKPPQFLSVGSFVGFKGYPTVIKALDKLKKNGFSFKYRIIGGGSSKEKSMIEQLVKEYGLEENVILLGRQPYAVVRSEMVNCDALIMACETFQNGEKDGLPNVIIESMLLRRPVVSTYISDIPNIIQHGVNGYLFPEKCDEALADILKYFYSDYGDTAEVVERAHQLAMKTFNAEINYKELEKILVE